MVGITLKSNLMQKGQSFTYAKKGKGKVWVHPNEAYAKTWKESKKAAQSLSGWLT